jgi:hypothetical protein
MNKKFVLIALKKIWFRVRSVTTELFKHGNSGKNRKKRIEIFPEY